MSESKYVITQPMKEEHGYEVKDGPEVISSVAYLDGGGERDQGLRARAGQRQ